MSSRNLSPFLLLAFLSILSGAYAVVLGTALAPQITPPPELRAAGQEWIGYYTNNGTTGTYQCNSPYTASTSNRFAGCCRDNKCTFATACRNNVILAPGSTSTSSCPAARPFCHEASIYATQGDASATATIVQCFTTPYDFFIVATAAGHKASTSSSSSSGSSSNSASSASSSAPAASSTSASPSPSPSPSKAWIAGPVLGGLAFLTALAGFVFWLLRRRSSKKRQAIGPATVDQNTAYSPLPMNAQGSPVPYYAGHQPMGQAAAVGGVDAKYAYQHQGQPVQGYQQEIDGNPVAGPQPGHEKRPVELGS